MWVFLLFACNIPGVCKVGNDAACPLGAVCYGGEGAKPGERGICTPYVPTVTVSTLAGSGPATYEGGDFADGPGAAARFNNPSGIVMDTQARLLYVADLHNQRIRVVTLAGVVSTLAGSGELGFVDGPGSEAAFRNPVGMAVDPKGNLYVTDYFNYRIRKVTPSGEVSTFAGSGEPGLVDGPGSVAQFDRPAGAVVDAEGNLYVTDFANHRIRKISPEGEVSTLAGSGPTGEGGGGFADGPGTAARFHYPYGIAIDAKGTLYVVDAGNHRIRKISPEGEVSTLAGSGEAGFADGDGSTAQLRYPYGMAMDAEGNLYVADTANCRIRKVTPEGIVSTFAGSGVQGSADGPGSLAQFNVPFDVTLDKDGTLYVVDSYGHRVRKLVVE